MMTEARPDQPALTLPYRVSTLPSRKPTRFDLKLTPAQAKAVCADLGLLDVQKFSFKGELRPVGRNDFALEGRLVADVAQPCSVTLVPVRSAISEAVTRHYKAGYVLPEGDEVEMPEDDTLEPLPEVIDLGMVALEALALALPLYPRAPGVELGEAVYSDPEITPLRDADLKPFAGLAALKGRLGGSKDGGEDPA
ncbi:MAG: hypothetical protein RIT14_1990 [Pseudomonadota bacterium]|jgi:uncharacterized metal-binding protein YceD (DUF177 family)